MVTSKKIRKDWGKIMGNIKSDETEKKGYLSSPLLKELMSYAKIIVLAILIAFICNNYIIVNAQIKSDSMNNEIKKSDRLFGFRLSYMFSSPQRGDVVIFKFPDDETKLYIKRVIGLPGDVVQIESGVLYINGEIYNEDYLKAPMVGSFGPYCVPADHYFMLGDNRNISIDSRRWQNTYVSKNKIIAKAILKYYSSLEFIK